MALDDRAILFGGTGAALALPALAIGLDVPFVVAVPVAALAGFGIALVSKRKSRADAFDVARYGRGRAEAVRQLVSEAEASISSIREAAVRAGDDRPAVEGLATHAAAILDRLVSNPGAIAASRRFLAYYLPQAAILAEALASVAEAGHLDPDRTRAMRETLTRLTDAFRQFARSAAEADLGPIDVQMRLLNETLDQDFAVPVLPETQEVRR